MSHRQGAQLAPTINPRAIFRVMDRVTPALATAIMLRVNLTATHQP